jgi:hypothetical protein
MLSSWNNDFLLFGAAELGLIKRGVVKGILPNSVKLFL